MCIVDKSAFPRLIAMPERLVVWRARSKWRGVEVIVAARHLAAAPPMILSAGVATPAHSLSVLQGHTPPYR
jgi:hypothetical protein